MIALIGKVIVGVVGVAVVLAIVSGLVTLTWLAYEQANGLNPFQ
jgi:hypothetical protein